MTQIVLQLIASVVAAGALVPLLVSLVIQSHWRKRYRTLAMLVVSLLSGAGTYFLDHKLTGADLHNPSQIVTVVVGVLLASAAAYRVLWKPSGVTDGIEKATSSKKGERGVAQLRIAAILAAVLIIVGLTAASPVKAEAWSWDSHAAVLRNDTPPSRGGNPVLVCHHWGVSSCYSGYGWLYYGQNTKSKYGWSDADGYYLYRGERNGGLVGPRWVKVRGCFGCVYGVRAIG